MKTLEFTKKLTIFSCIVLVIVSTFTSCKSNKTKPANSENSNESNIGANSMQDFSQDSSTSTSSTGMNSVDSLSLSTANSVQKGASSMNASDKNSRGETISILNPNDIDTPAIINTTYPTRDIVVADYVVTNSSYGADKTGFQDCTQIIQDAINDCHYDGGGTVYLPKGKYRITRAITVRAFVTLRGDWQDPDIGNQYGTIILADIASSVNDLPALFTIGGSAGVMGLTIYYPKQNINDIKAYPFTFNIPGAIPNIEDYMLSSIVDCTIINGYKGVVASKYDKAVNEQINIDGLKGTLLHTGLELYNSADASVVQNVILSNRYWADAGSGFSGANKTEIDKYTRTNAKGFIYGDLEWSQHARLYASDYNIGMHIVNGLRGNGTQFDGGIYDLQLLNCNIGLLVDKIDDREGFGMAIAKASIIASSKAVINNTSGNIKIEAVSVTGGFSGSGVNKITVKYPPLSIYPDFTTVKMPSKPSNRLFNVKTQYGADNKAQTDCTKLIQKALNDAQAAGGGIVYLPAGYYKILNAISIPKGVELRGATSVATRDQIGMSKGTVIMAYVGKNTQNPDSDKALITLQGENAGIRGLRIVYPEYNVAKEFTESQQISKYPFTIRGLSDGVYVVNVGLAGVYSGIEILGSSNYYIKNISASIYKTGIRISNSKSGYISTCLSNVTNMSRQGYWQLTNYPQLFTNGWTDGSEDEIYNKIIVPTMMKNFKFLDFINSSNQLVENIFSYGALNTITVSGGNVSATNIGADTYYKIPTSGPMVVTKNSCTLQIINLIRFNGSSYQQEAGTILRLYNRITIYLAGEADKTN